MQGDRDRVGKGENKREMVQVTERKGEKGSEVEKGGYLMIKRGGGGEETSVFLL